MKSLLLLSIVFIAAIAGCKRETVIDRPNGIYTGTFTRSSPDARYAPSKVTITFDGNNFTGTSENARYPALCSGTFSTTGQKMIVVNSCAFTADFDWTYIFTGDYTFEMIGNKLKITKSYANNTYDEYNLEKQ